MGCMISLPLWSRVTISNRPLLPHKKQLHNDVHHLLYIQEKIDLTYTM